MLLRLSRNASLLSKEAALLGRAPAFIQRAARGGHGAAYEAARAAQIAKSEAALAGKSVAPAITEAATPNIASLRTAATPQSRPLIGDPRLTGLEQTAIRPVPRMVDDSAEAMSRAHLIEEPVLPSFLRQTEKTVAGGPTGTAVARPPRGAGTDAKTVAQAAPEGKTVAQAAPEGRTAVQKAPKPSQRDIKTQKIDRPKKPEGVPFKQYLAASGLGAGAGVGSGALTNPDAMPKAASLVGAGIKGALGAGKTVGKAAVKTPLRRGLLGTGLLAGGLGVYGAAQGTGAQHPYTPNPLAPPNPTPYGRIMRGAYQELR